MGGVGCQWGVVLAQWGAGRVLQGTWHRVQGTGYSTWLYWPNGGHRRGKTGQGRKNVKRPLYPSSCFKTESEKFNSVLDSILMFGGSQTGLLENHEMNSFVLMIDLDLDLCPYTIVHVTQINFWGSIYTGFNALRKRVMYRNRCLTTRALDPHRVSFRELTARAIPH